MKRAHRHREPSFPAKFATILGLGLAFVVCLGGVSLFVGHVITTAFRLFHVAIV